MLSNVVGQLRAKEALILLGNGYRRRGYIPPIGIFGGSGLGKTYLVDAWCNELGAKVIYINGTAVKDALAFRGFFREAAENSSNYFIIFVDECHGLPKKVQDNLLSVLEQPAILCTVAPKDMGTVRCVDGLRYIQKGDVMREQLPKNMSFVLATTDPAKLKDPILNRLRKIHLENYTLEDKIQIAVKHFHNHGVRSSELIYRALAERCRSIRHLKNELCETYFDISHLNDNGEVYNLHQLDNMLGIDSDGATDLDMDYLQNIANHQIVGLDTMAGMLGIDKHEILKHIEPFLLSKGWILITGKGRKLTDAGLKKVLGDDYVSSGE